MEYEKLTDDPELVAAFPRDLISEEELGYIKYLCNKGRKIAAIKYVKDYAKSKTLGLKGAHIYVDMWTEN